MAWLKKNLKWVVGGGILFLFIVFLSMRGCGGGTPPATPATGAGASGTGAMPPIHITVTGGTAVTTSAPAPVAPSPTPTPAVSVDVTAGVLAERLYDPTADAESRIRAIRMAGSRITPANKVAVLDVLSWALRDESQTSLFEIVRQVAEHEIKRQGKDGVDCLVSKLNATNDENSRAACLQCLREIGKEVYFPLIRQAAIVGGDVKEEIEKLFLVLGDPTLSTRPAVEEALRLARRDKDARVAFLADDWLGKIK